MIDYCLLICFFQQDIKTYNLFGNYRIHPNVSNIIECKNIKKTDEPELIIIYKQKFIFIDYYCMNAMSINAKWLLIVPESLEDGRKIYQNIKSFGEHYFVEYPEPLIIIKNIKPNYKELYRAEILDFSNSTDNLDDFLELNILENKISTEVISDNEEKSIVRSLSTNKDFVYVGEILPDKTILKNQMIAKMKFNIIVNYKDNVIKGYFVRKNFINEFWIWKLTNYNMVEQFLKIKEKTIITGV